jgi:hypothetical protein
MNNPQAFPDGLGNKGMTLRDYFAAKAMQALLSDTDWRIDMDIEDTAKAAYMTADAMMKAREQ